MFVIVGSNTVDKQGDIALCLPVVLLLCYLCVGGGWGLSGRDSNEDGRGLGEETGKSNTRLYFAGTFIYSHITREKY